MIVRSLGIVALAAFATTPAVTRQVWPPEEKEEGGGGGSGSGDVDNELGTETFPP